MNLQKISLLRVIINIMLLAPIALCADAVSVSKPLDMNPVLAGSQLLRDRVYETLTINGAYNNHAQLINCTINRSLFIECGVVELQKTFFDGGIIIGGQKIKISSSTVTGELTVNGALEASDVKFEAPLSLREGASFHGNSKIQSISMPADLHAKPTIHLYGNTVVKGSIEFKSGNGGQVVVHDNAKIQGRVIGGEEVHMGAKQQPAYANQQSHSQSYSGSHARVEKTTSQTVNENTDSRVAEAVGVGLLYYLVSSLFGGERQLVKIIRNEPYSPVTLNNETCDVANLTASEIKLNRCVVGDMQAQAAKVAITDSKITQGTVGANEVTLESSTIKDRLEIKGPVYAVKTTAHGELVLHENAHFYNSTLAIVTVPAHINASCTIHLYGATIVNQVRFLNARGGKVVLHDGAKVFGNVVGGTIEYSKA